MFDIEKRDEDGRTALHHAIWANKPIIVELLLKEYHANPNVIDSENNTTLMYWATKKDRNISILTLLVKYGFDLARLVNQRDHQYRYTVFHILCRSDSNTDNKIACLKQLFSMCQKIPNCSINILAQNHQGACGLHCAILCQDIDVVKHLLENVYFPNNDKSNKDGIAFINMKINGVMSLATIVISVLTTKWDGKVKRDLEMFKLLVSYGMKFNSQDERYFRAIINYHYAEVVTFILDENFFPIDTLDKIVDFMYKANEESLGSVNNEILKSFYNYGLKHGMILNKSDHKQILIESAKYALSTFKTTILMILYKHGINDLQEYKQCDIFDDITMKTILQSPGTKTRVKSFIKALISDDETKLLKLDHNIRKSNEVVLTCINNHKLNNKIVNYNENCSVCGDSADDSQSLSGFECDECKSFICNDCIFVQKISKKINNNGNNVSELLAATNQIYEYKNNKKLLNKVELIKFFIKFLHFFFLFFFFLWLLPF